MIIRVVGTPVDRAALIEYAWSQYDMQFQTDEGVMYTRLDERPLIVLPEGREPMCPETTDYIVEHEPKCSHEVAYTIDDLNDLLRLPR